MKAKFSLLFFVYLKINFYLCSALQNNNARQEQAKPILLRPSPLHTSVCW